MAKLEIVVYCSQCGETLEVSSDYVGNLSVGACHDCAATKYDHGYDDGYDEGFSDAEAEERDDG